VRVTSGGTPSRSNPEFYEDGEWAWVKTQELLDSWIDDTEEHITEIAIDKSSAKILPEQTILLALYGATVGQLGVLRRPMTCNQACCAIIVNPDEADYRYLFYLLIASRRQLKSLATGAAQQNLSGTLIKNFVLPFPKLEVQQRIADILGKLDDKIELNRRMNRTLEKMAAAIFKSWFIDFDPVHAKAEGRDPNLPAEIADLFPNAFEDSDLGPIPKGWDVAALKDLADVNARSIKKNYPHVRIRYVDISSVSRGDLDETTNYNIADAPSRARRLVQTGDTIWSCVRPNRKAYLYINQPSENLVVSTGFAVLTPRSVPASYLHQWVTTQAFVDYLTAYATGAAYPAVKAETFEAAKMIRPSRGILESFQRLIDPLRARIAHGQRQNRSLIGLRDTLLPKLISGAVPVPEL
jgi:type I restriction enzyme S subunit